MIDLVNVVFGGARHPQADPNCKLCQNYVRGKGWIATGVDINCGGQVELCKCVIAAKARKAKAEEEARKALNDFVRVVVEPWAVPAIEWLTEKLNAMRPQKSHE